MRAYVRERAYVRYTRILIIFQTCQDISHWTYLKMTEISYVLADILNILGYHDLFSDLSIRIKVPDRPLKCIFASNSGWVRVRCLCLHSAAPDSFTPFQGVMRDSRSILAFPRPRQPWGVQVARRCGGKLEAPAAAARRRASWASVLILCKGVKYNEGGGSGGGEALPSGPAHVLHGSS